MLQMLPLLLHLGSINLVVFHDDGVFSVQAMATSAVRAYCNRAPRGTPEDGHMQQESFLVWLEEIFTTGII